MAKWNPLKTNHKRVPPQGQNPSGPAIPKCPVLGKRRRPFARRNACFMEANRSAPLWALANGHQYIYTHVYNECTYTLVNTYIYIYEYPNRHQHRSMSTHVSLILQLHNNGCVPHDLWGLTDSYPLQVHPSATSTQHTAKTAPASSERAAWHSLRAVAK